MDVSVIIVTYNSAEHISACLQSVLAQKGVSFEIIVADNASQDDTLKELANYHIRVIANRENVGFGRGNNAAFAVSAGRYLYLLNPDARLTAPNALAELCRRMDANPSWGMAGTRVQSSDGISESPPSPEYPAQRHTHRDFSKLPGKIAWISGASIIVRRELYEKLGGFDPGFFLYSEETDFCLRMRELGHEIGYVPNISVEHIGGASEDMRDLSELSARKLKGLLLFRQKHYPVEDCVFLAKRDLQRARLRMYWNGFLARWQRPQSKAWRKYQQYHGIWQASRDYLSSTGHKP